MFRGFCNFELTVSSCAAKFLALKVSSAYIQHKDCEGKFQSEIVPKGEK